MFTGMSKSQWEKAHKLPKDQTVEPPQKKKKKLVFLISLNNIVSELVEMVKQNPELYLEKKNKEVEAELYFMPTYKRKEAK